MTLVCRALDTFVFGPVYWLREKVVEPLKGESYPWYHRRYPRVPSIDECYTDDLVCRWLAEHSESPQLLYVFVPITMPYSILYCREEANAQFKRDWLVEEEIITLLRARMQDCYFYEKGTGP